MIRLMQRDARKEVQGGLALFFVHFLSGLRHRSAPGCIHAVTCAWAQSLRACSFLFMDVCVYGPSDLEQCAIK